MYLANDVIQNSKKKGPEYGKEFNHVLGKVFAHIGEKCGSDKLLGSLGRILNIWLERGVYDPKVIADWRARLHRESTAAGGASSSSNGKSNGSSEKPEKEREKDKDHASSKSEKSERREKRKHEDRHSKSKRPRQHAQTSSTSSSNYAPPAEEVVVVEPENGHTPPYPPLLDVFVFIAIDRYRSIQKYEPLTTRYDHSQFFSFCTVWDCSLVLAKLMGLVRLYSMAESKYESMVAPDRMG